MKTNTANPKAELLIGAGLDVLHFESEQWMSTFAFYRDETKFFTDLLKKVNPKNAQQPAYGKILSKLESNEILLLDSLLTDIQAHEKLLSRIELGEIGLADEDYRDAHRQLKKSVAAFTSNFREFKKMVFDYVKNLGI